MNSLSKQYLSIEGLRGVLALIVCLGHFGLGTLLNPWGIAFNLHFAVDLFFIISGLVIAHSNYYGEHPVSAYQFTVKRFARLYPLHGLTLLVICLLNFAQEIPVSVLSVMKNLFLIHNIGLGEFDKSLNFPSWSISIELWSTLLLFFITQTIKNRPLVTLISIFYLAVYCLYVSYYFMAGAYEGNLNGFLNSGLLRGFAGMLLGILIYFTLHSPASNRFFKSHLIGYLSFLGLLLFLFLELPSQSASYFYIFAYFFIGTLAYKNTFLAMLNLSLFVQLGAISYSIYLLHIPLYHLLQWQFGDIAVKGVTGKLILLPLLLVISFLSFYFFELPLQRLIKNLLLKSSNALTKLSPKFASLQAIQRFND